MVLLGHKLGALGHTHPSSTMADEASGTLRSYHSLFHSQTDRIHSPVKPARPGQGRTLGPSTYHPPEPEWLFEENKQGSAFASKVPKNEPTVTVLTAEIDYYAPPDSLHSFMHRSAPGERSFPWSQEEQRPAPKGDRSFDGIYDPDAGSKQSFASAVKDSKRTFASSFKSDVQRFRYKESFVPAPGTYDVPNYSVSVRDPKRTSSSFRSTLKSSFSTTQLPEAPDYVLSPELETLAAQWRSKGYPISSRERFPRPRQRWAYG